MPSVAQFVFAGAERLERGPHPERALQDAERLMMHVLGKDRAWMLAYWHDEIGVECTVAYRSVIERRREGEPIQYIVGETEFFGLPFRVTRDVLIPRPETEHVVERALALARGLDGPRIVDVGTGSGAIAVALASNLPKASVTATDLSPAALAVALENAAGNNVAHRIRFLGGDLLDPVRGEIFDMVVSNPPYVPESDRELLAVEVRDFEPALALFADEDGMAIYRRLIPEAVAALCPGGWIVLEIGYGQQGAVRALLGQSGFDEVDFVADLQGIPRVACARRR
ncbi:MAG TPA: peptide chain release factor N(5)-glutamine methyltransferase [Terracidiphilus sp.]|jgi:release factor glutamine methyltransferase|nr:peptide chain release factor N(5)-glutamine methyltransferase [Terracidiphilus sp.]